MSTPRSGSHRKDKDLGALFEEKDAEIDRLRIALEAHISHAVGANTRLASTLDTLDSLQARHASELSAEVEAKERLQCTLTKYLDVVRVAEFERDYLRDAVNELADKIESSKDVVNSLPQSRIWISRLLEPIQSMPNAASFSLIAKEDSIWAYAAGMITFLRDALASERHAHAETRTAARARIAILEAQLARREAELEACVVHAGQASGSSKRNLRRPDMDASQLPPSFPPIPTDDMNAFLERTSSQNVLLEEELERMVARLHQARIAGKRAVPPSDMRPPVAGVGVDGASHRPSTSQDRPRRHNGQHGILNVNGKQPRSDSHRSRSPAPRPLSPNSRQNTDTLEADPDRTVRPDPPLATRLTTDTEDVHSAFNQEIAALNAKIDDFHVEREILIAEVQAQGNAKSGDRAHLNTRRREKQTRPTQTQIPAARPPTPGPRSGGHLLEDYDGEMSMDLATPLFPTVIIPLAGPSTMRHPPTPAVVPPEISPLDLSSEHPLPPVAAPPHADALPPGEQAVQELMNLATAGRKGAS
ncbi:hypothetical protein B0H11DRAFT_1201820 [Mycena galericulata]|nr:hypothetical protein B0H11DRAFT_1201820 [Mycena galericulata]